MTTLKSLAKMIDHSLLHPTMTDAEILNGCEIARKHDVATVCVKPYAVTMCKNALQGSDVKVCSVIGFPHGNHNTRIKVVETELAIREGLALVNAMHITASVFINDDESGLHHDYEKWLERLAPHQIGRAHV